MGIKSGDRVRFSAETPTWGLNDWYGPDRVAAVDSDGKTGVVEYVEIAGPQGETLYLDVRFDDGSYLGAICSSHFTLVRAA